MDAKRADVIVVGGGPVGMSLALALRAFGPDIAVTLVDARQLKAPRDERATAVSAGVSAVFEALGLWRAMAGAASPVAAMKITDSGSGDIFRPVFLDFFGEVAPGRPFAHMVPNSVLAEALISAVGSCGAEVIAPAGVVGLERAGNLARVRLADGTALEAPVVVAADGGRSALRRMAGIETMERDYGQTGLVATISHSVPHGGVAFEHFRPAGPFASLPLPGDRSSLVWTESRATAGRMLKEPAANLEREIEAAMGSTLGRVKLESGVQGFELKLTIARKMVADRLALVGDAAHVIHPVAGQGLNLGVKDIAALAEVLISAMRLGEDIGGGAVLERYQRWRRFDVARMVAVTDGLNRLFSNDSEALRALRDTGLGLVDRLGGLKKAMIGQAAGVAGQSGPKLLRGLAI